jgi:phosphoribosylformylglycinamidine synthase
LQEKKTTVDEYQWLVIPWWFSYGDRPRSGKSFAEIICHNPLMSGQFEAFRISGKFVLGVCNGNQVLMELWWITDSYGLPILPMQHNDSWYFESRFLALEIVDTNNRFFTGMAWHKLPIWVAHGEGKYADVLSTKEINIAARYINAQWNATQTYPYNPNGSLEAIAWIVSQDGNILGMMPHPERTILPHQMAYVPKGSDPETLSWMPMFRNLRKSV